MGEGAVRRCWGTASGRQGPLRTLDLLTDTWCPTRVYTHGFTSLRPLTALARFPHARPLPLTLPPYPS